jgi:hypothetical protein
MEATETETEATKMAAEALPRLIEELETEFPGGRVLSQVENGGYLRIKYGAECYAGTTPQSERWVGVELTASYSRDWTGRKGVRLDHMKLSPEIMTSTGRWLRSSGFYSPDVHLRSSGSITCSAGPSLNGGEGPGRMAMFTGCLRIAERVAEWAQTDE